MGEKGSSLGNLEKITLALAALILGGAIYYLRKKRNDFELRAIRDASVIQPEVLPYLLEDLGYDRGLYEKIKSVIKKGNPYYGEHKDEFDAILREYAY